MSRKSIQRRKRSSSSSSPNTEYKNGWKIKKIPITNEIVTPEHHDNDEEISNKFFITEIESKKCLKFNFHPISEIDLSNLQQSFLGSKPFISSNLSKFQITEQPFKVVQIRDFLTRPNDLQTVIDQISKKDLNILSNDLYSLRQSKDLKNYPEFKSLVRFFETKVRTLIMKITKFDLTPEVALTYSEYKHNDYLLCHDDRLGRRKIAFVLYNLDSDWSHNDGGLLELFYTDQVSGQPTPVFDSLLPKNNMLIFFEVSKISFHQVSEILRHNSSRRSINGWFFTKDECGEPKSKLIYPFIETLPQTDLLLEENLQAYFSDWINPDYLQSKTQHYVRQIFAKKSEVRLKNFLRLDKVLALDKSFNTEQTANLWTQDYRPLFWRLDYIPPTKFNDLPETLKEFYLLINSNSFLNLIFQLTGVEFKKRSKSASRSKSKYSMNAFETNHSIRGKILRWQQGYYSLCNSLNPEWNERAIDIDFFFNVPLVSKKKFGDQEIIQISDDDDDDGEAANGEVNQNCMKKTNGVCKEPKDSRRMKNEKKDDQNNRNESKPKQSRKMIKSNRFESDENIFVDDCDEKHYQSNIKLLDRDHGGVTSYIANDSEIDCQILDIHPANGFMMIVFRNGDCQRFVKYIDSDNQRIPFNQISVCFSDIESTSSS
ncbi:hypothetical protein NH340_JMT00205 [Sarcoptes scabiei]|nr:hypothetical protein NH340_JMT00205 [Sarcoptes scabiei]